jgi:soluble lytic murein transglycosylase-like protein
MTASGRVVTSLLVVTGLLLITVQAVMWRDSLRESHLRAALATTRHTLDSIRTAHPRNLLAERDSLVVQTARRLGLSESVALAVAWVENPRADSTAVSRSGAVGLMQVMPGSAIAARGDSLGGVSRDAYIRSVCGSRPLVERSCNVDVGLQIFREYADRYDETDALAAYNGALSYPRAAHRYVSAVRTYALAMETLRMF